MAGEAGELPTLEAGGFDQAIVFAPADLDHAIAPEKIVQDFGVARQELWDLLQFAQVTGADDGRGFLEVIARPVFESFAAPLAGLIDLLHRVAEAANLGCPLGRDLPRVDDFIRLEANGGVLKLFDRGGASLGMFPSRAVAGFAGDAKLRHPGGERAGGDI